ncbi:hypothetical protein TNCT_550431 [Trichonephila clavata]|uniref:Uncharacterized protein n=1 Tax=Trichonephila clavata TaxID=2740835 RepID=A0A8X6GYW5_TRICU|nr:hypothetical protein TNCT_550431 [Trichonephila clavata]
MSKVILMSTFVLLHSLWCLFEIFGHLNLQYCLHLIPYYIFIQLLKLKSRNLKREFQNTDQKINNSLAITEPEEKIELSAEIADKKLIENYEDGEIDSNKDEIMSDISVLSIPEDKNALSNRMDNSRSFKKFSRFTQQNIYGVMEQTFAHSTETPLAKYSKYVFYDDNGEQFIIDNAEFEEEEKEIIDIFNSNLEILQRNPFYEMGYRNENYFIPIPFNASPCNSADEDVQDNNILSNEKLKILQSNPFYEIGHRNENYFIPTPLNASPCNSADEDVQDNIPNNMNLEILPSNPFYEMGSRNENYFIPTPLNASPCNSADEDEQGHNIPKNEKLEILPNNPFYEMLSSNENYLIPIALKASPCNSADEDEQENAIDSSKKKNVFRKVKSFFKKLRAEGTELLLEHITVEDDVNCDFYGWILCYCGIFLAPDYSHLYEADIQMAEVIYPEIFECQKHLFQYTYL